MPDEPLTIRDLERFWSRVKIGIVPVHEQERGPCWEWTGGCLPHSYGRISIRGRTVLAHRVAWSIAHGPIPDGLWVLHHCDNKICVRPSHLFVGTAQDNKADWARKYWALGASPHWLLSQQRRNAA